jgi:hypothetical protein
VVSFSEETYHCLPGDTFESISQKKYNTPSYAGALLLFNRDHPLAGDAFQAGTLRPGQAVYVPQAAILEERYPTAIKNLSPLAVTPPRPAAGVTPAPGVGAAADGGPAYRVRGSGVWLRDVARDTLGNSERWQEIWSLNPAVDNRVPLPPSAVLRLPAGARVPAGNAP